MATKQSTIDFLTEQLSGLNNLRTRKMFGEYAVYCDEKVIGFVCDDQLFIKPIPEAKMFIGNPEEAPPYPGAKNYYLISADKWEDREWLIELVQTVAVALPLPTPKKKSVK
jgi:TfoX/Sxy family transcriptional regulator of competence genes